MIQISYPLTSAMLGGSYTVLSRFRILRVALVLIQVSSIILCAFCSYQHQTNIDGRDSVPMKIADFCIDFFMYFSHWMLLLHVTLMADSGVDIILLVHLLVYRLDNLIYYGIEYYYSYQFGVFSLVVPHMTGLIFQHIMYFSFGAPTYILIVRVLSLTYQELLKREDSTTKKVWKYLIILGVFILLTSLTSKLLELTEVLHSIISSMMELFMNNILTAGSILFETYIISFIDPFERWRKCVLGISYHYNLLQKLMMIISGIFIGRALSSLTIASVACTFSEKMIQEFGILFGQPTKIMLCIYMILEALRMPAFWYYCIGRVKDATEARDVPDRYNPYSTIIEIPEDFDTIQR